LDSPDISLIIRYSRPETIGRALKSVRDQLWQQPAVSVELLIVDALGTAENYQRLCEVEPILAGENLSMPVQIKDSLALRWISTARPLTRAQALQTGIDRVRGRLTMFLDDDDTFDSNHIEKLYYGYAHAIASDDRVIAVSTGVRLIRALPATPEQFEIVNLYDAPLDPKRLVLSNALPLMGFICSTEALRKCSIDLQLEIYEDWDLLLQLAQIGRFVHLPGVTANYFFNTAGSGVHHGALPEEVARRVRLKWIQKLNNADFEKMRHDLALTERLINENQALMNNLSKSNVALEHYRQLYTVMSQSISWKITAPLRNLRRIVRQITQR
jgi:glycosyltransferase involved in cell wall biosynthesis